MELIDWNKALHRRWLYNCIRDYPHKAEPVLRHYGFKPRIRHNKSSKWWECGYHIQGQWFMLSAAPTFTMLTRRIYGQTKTSR